jgi:hypothetical protein
MENRTRVTFRFGRDIEVQYVSRTPDVGDRVTHGRGLWVVTDVKSDDAGTVVICERPTRNGGDDCGAVEDLALRR